jgi:hypothetical protein
LDDPRVLVADIGVEKHGWPQAQSVEQLNHPPDADAHAIISPAEMIGSGSRRGSVWCEGCVATYQRSKRHKSIQNWQKQSEKSGRRVFHPASLGPRSATMLRNKSTNKKSAGVGIAL